MKTILRPDSTFSFAGFYWVYIFISLLFFGNSTTFSEELSQAQNSNLHNNVLFYSEYRQSTELPVIHSPNVNIILTFDLGDEHPGISHIARSDTHPLNMKITACSHLHLKNSPNTIRMISSVLLV